MSSSRAKGLSFAVYAFYVSAKVCTLNLIHICQGLRFTPYAHLLRFAVCTFYTSVEVCIYATHTFVTVSSLHFIHTCYNYYTLEDSQ